jgi:N-glycosidase YbiA
VVHTDVERDSIDLDEPIYFYTKAQPFHELSNFAPLGFEADAVYWPTVEHFFQAQKFTDAAYRERIRRAASARAARDLGQSREMPIRPDWDEVREAVMLSALRRKFSEAHLVDLLLSTGDRELVESSPVDHFWGCGQDGSGQNRLGRLLMKVRSELRIRAAPGAAEGTAGNGEPMRGARAAASDPSGHQPRKVHRKTASDSTTDTPT